MDKISKVVCLGIKGAGGLDFGELYDKQVIAPQCEINKI